MAVKRRRRAVRVLVFSHPASRRTGFLPPEGRGFLRVLGDPAGSRMTTKAARAGRLWVSRYHAEPVKLLLGLSQVINVQDQMDQHRHIRRTSEDGQVGGW
jgi:hypothetical protein